MKLMKKNWRNKMTKLEELKKAYNEAYEGYNEAYEAYKEALNKSYEEELEKQDD